MDNVIHNLNDIASQRRSMMLATLNIREWGATRIDKKATHDAQEANEASTDSGRFNKLLLPKDVLAPWTTAKGKVRAELYKLTLPWADDGFRVLSVDAFFDLQANVDNRRAEAMAVVKDIADHLDDHKVRAKEMLGKMYDEALYPSPEELVRRYSITLTILPMPAGKDFRCDLDDATVKELQDAIDKRVTDSLDAANKDIFARVYEVTDHMATMLDKFTAGEATRFHGTLVSNVQKLAETLPMLNVTKDPRVQQLCDDMVRLTHHKVDVLKGDNGLRADTAKNARRLSERARAWM
jgi:hypothetical protein